VFRARTRAHAGLPCSCAVDLAQLGIILLRFQFVPVIALDADQLQSLVVELTAEDDDRDVLFHFDGSVLDASSSVPNSI
jgi:hypothetical protein